MDYGFIYLIPNQLKVKYNLDEVLDLIVSLAD